VAPPVVAKGRAGAAAVTWGAVARMATMMGEVAWELATVAAAAWSTLGRRTWQGTARIGSRTDVRRPPGRRRCTLCCTPPG
jgi:hypothetical protein